MRKRMSIILLGIICIILSGCSPKETMTKENIKDFSNRTIDKTFEISGVIKEKGKKIIDVIKSSDDEELEVINEESLEENKDEIISEVVAKEDAVEPEKVKEESKPAVSKPTVEAKPVEIAKPIVEPKPKEEVKPKEEPKAKEEAKPVVIEPKKEEGEKDYFKSIIGVWYNQEYNAIVTVNEFNNVSFGTRGGAWDALSTIKEKTLKADSIDLLLSINYVDEPATSKSDSLMNFKKIDKNTLDVTNDGFTTRFKYIGKNMDEANR